jgi:hypothetical protein
MLLPFEGLLKSSSGLYLGSLEMIDLTFFGDSLSSYPGVFSLDFSFIFSLGFSFSFSMTFSFTYSFTPTLILTSLFSFGFTYYLGYSLTFSMILSFTPFTFSFISFTSTAGLDSLT